MKRRGMITRKSAGGKAPRIKPPMGPRSRQPQVKPAKARAQQSRARQSPPCPLRGALPFEEEGELVLPKAGTLVQVKWTDGWHVCAVTSVDAEKLEFNVQVLIGQAGQPFAATVDVVETEWSFVERRGGSRTLELRWEAGTVKDIADIDATTDAAYVQIRTCEGVACTIARRPGGTFRATERALVADAYSAFRAAVKGQISAGWVPLGSTIERSSLANVRHDYQGAPPYDDSNPRYGQSGGPAPWLVDRASGDRNSIRLCQTMALYESTE